MANNIFNEQTNIAFTGLDKMTKMEWFDIQGLSGVQAVDISAMQNLKTFHAAGSGLASFNPANGASFTDVQLPITLRTIGANGVNLTYNNQCAITWWDGATQTTIPTGLTVLRFTGMGQDKGTQQLIHQWCEMLRNNPDKINGA